MISLNVTQTIMKYVISITFRILLVFYSIAIISFSENFFNIWVYIVYIFFYIFLYKKMLEKKKATYRTINDYIFITLILFNKNIEIFYYTILMLMPLFNAPNHTEKNRQPIFLFIITWITFLFLYYSYNHNIQIEILFYSLAVLGTLFIVSLFEYYRNSFNSKLLSIFTSIDDILSKKKSTSQLVDIYGFIINKFRGELKFNITKILVFVDVNNHTNIRSSSEFFHTYNINKIKKELKQNNVIYNGLISINNAPEENAIAMKIDKKYIFVVTVDSKVKIINILKLIYISELLIPIFKKIIKIIEFENSLNKQKYNINQELNKKSHFVNNIMKATHYFSNQLSSITNYFSMRHDYKNIKDKTIEKEVLKIIDSEEKRAIIALDNIKNKTLRVLNKKDNPFIPNQKKSIKYKYLYMIVKNIWMQYFFENQIRIINLDGKENDVIKNSDVSTLEFIFTDLFENVRKYGIGNKAITFDFTDKIHVQIINDIPDFINKKKKLSELAENFNKHDRLEINRRESYGLAHIKELSELINISTVIEIDVNKELFITNLYFEGE